MPKKIAHLLSGLRASFAKQFFFHCIYYLLEGDASNLRLTSHFFANYMNIFHKTEVQMVILRCRTGLYLNWFKSYDTKRKYFLFHFYSIL